VGWGGQWGRWREVKEDEEGEMEGPSQRLELVEIAVADRYFSQAK